MIPGKLPSNCFVALFGGSSSDQDVAVPSFCHPKFTSAIDDFNSIRSLPSFHLVKGLPKLLSSTSLKAIGLN